VSYWEDRQEKTYLAGEQTIDEYFKELKKAFETSKRDIWSVIDQFQGKYAQGNGVTFAEAQKRLSQAEIGELQDYIDKVNANLGTYNQELENMSIKARITRYEALEKQIDAVLQNLYKAEYEYKGSEKLKEIGMDSYNRTWYNMDIYRGFHHEFAQISPRKLDILISYPFDGKNYSQRLWTQKGFMQDKLMSSLTTVMVQGKNPRTLYRDFAKHFSNRGFEAYRLLHTEASFMIEQATLESYKGFGSEKYEILATLDTRTSKICQHQDGKVYDTDKAVTGVNYPPFHPFCRTTTVPFIFDDEFDDDDGEWERAARDPETGKTIKVSADMDYKEWYERYVEDVKTDKSSLQNGSSSLQSGGGSSNMKEDRMNSNEKLKSLVENLDKIGVDYNEVPKHSAPLSENEIIDVLSGGDRTKGSCASVGLAYIGQKGGMNVIDFRGGESQGFFSQRLNLKELAKFSDSNAVFETAKSYITAGNKLLKRIEIGKEYYLVVGRHASIVKRTDDGTLQYLELQSETKSGWTNFDGNPRYTLKTRFGCPRSSGKGYDVSGFMLDVEEFKNSEDLQILLGYINTSTGEQEKGAKGEIK
jgi:phage putative head morphogenesis protein, SPP1 gp7 family